MAVDQWPPSWWQAFIGLFGPYTDSAGNPSKFWNGLIPLMDVRQFMYDFAKATAGAIPHQPPVYTRPVNGMIGSVASGGTKIPVPLGAVGYNAETHQVIWSVNKQGGVQDQTLNMDVQAVIPTLWQLLTMVPWDFVSEAKDQFGATGMVGSDQAPSATDMATTLYGKLRDGLAGLGVSIPAAPGNISSRGASIADIIIPENETGYTVTNKTITYKAPVLTDTKIAPQSSVSLNGVYSTTSTADPTAVVGGRVTIELPAGVTGRTSLECIISSVTQGTGAVTATSATRNIIFKNAGILWTGAAFVLRITNDALLTQQVNAGNYTLNVGYGYTGRVNATAILAPGTSLFVLFTAIAKGEDPDYPAVGPIEASLIVPALLPGISLYSTTPDGNGVTGSPDVTLTAGDYTVTDGKTYGFTLPQDVTIVSGDESAPVLLTATTPGADVAWKGAGAVNIANISPGAFPATLRGRYSGGANGISASAGSPTQLGLVLKNTKSTSAMVVPAVQDIVFYNIPAMNFAQKIYDTAMELVESIPHHPAPYSRKVWVGGVYCNITYTLNDSSGNLVSVRDTPPAIDEVKDGKTLVVTANFTEEGGKPAGSRELLRYAFGNVVGHIVFEASVTGPDEFFSSLPDVGWDPAAIASASAEIQTLIDATKPLITAAQEILDNAQAALQAAIDTAVAGGLPAPAPDSPLYTALADAETALQEKQTRLTLQEERLALIGGRGNGLPSALEGFPIDAPAELSALPAKAIRLVGLEKGLDQVVDSEGTEILPASTTKFRLEFTILPMGSPDPVITLPGSFAAYTPGRPVSTRVRMIADERGAVPPEDFSGGITVTSTSFTGGAAWMDVQLRELVSLGTAADEEAEPGSSPGTPAEIYVDVLNKTGTDETVTGPFSFSITIGSVAFTIAPEAAIADAFLLFPKHASLTYSGNADGTSFQGQPLADLQIDFSCPVMDTQAWARWETADRFSWIGEEFSLTGNSGINRYVQARMRYKLMDSVDPYTGSPAPSKAWYLEYTGEGEAGGTRAATPHGACAIMEIEYDASRKLVLVRNLRNGEFIEMRTNAVIWFLIQLLILIPMEVI